MGFIDESQLDEVGGGSFISEDMLDPQATANPIQAMLGQAANTLPFGDVLAAGSRAAYGSLFNGEDYSSTYDSALNEVRSYEDAAYDASPAISTVGNLAGAVGTLPNLGLVSKAKGFLPTAKALALEGGSLGALLGFESGKGSTENRLVNSAAMTLFGAPLTVAGGGLAIGASKALGGIGSLFSKLMPSEAADSAALATPEVQTSLNLASRIGGPDSLLNKAPSEISSIGPATKEAIEAVNVRARDLGNNIAAQLGASGGNNAVERAFAKEFSEGVPELVKSGIFDKAATVPELLEVAGTRLDDINLARTQSAEVLDKFANTLGRKVGIIKGSTPGIDSAVRDLNERISQLKTSSLAKPIWESIEGTKNTFIKDISSGLSPKQAVNTIRTLNEVRRTLIQEFDTAKINAKLTGNTPSSSFQGSIEAIGKLQSALSKSLEDSVQQISNATGLSVPKDYFSSLNKEYGALKSLQDMATKFIYGTTEGLAVKSPARALQNAGANETISSLFSPKEAVKGAIANKIAKIADAPSQTLQRATAVNNRNANAMKNIQDLIYLNKNPAQLSAPAMGLGERIGASGAGLESLSGSSALKVIGDSTEQAKSPRQSQSAQGQKQSSRSSLPKNTTVKELFQPKTETMDPAMDPKRYKALTEDLQAKTESGIKKIEAIIDEDPFDAAVYEMESSRNPKAKNPTSSASGGFQLIKKTAKNLGVNDVFDLKENYGGFLKLKQEIKDRFQTDDPAILYAGHYLGSTVLGKYLKGDDLTPQQSAQVKYFENTVLPKFMKIYSKITSKTVEA